MKSLNLFVTFLFVTFYSLGQETQTVRGKIIDKISQYPLINASIVVLNTDPVIGTVTDFDGYFELKNVPLGRQSFQVAYVGYDDAVRSNILVSSGKELILNFELEEQVVMVEEAVITIKDKAKTNNENVTVSGRTFSIEETQRYAGSRNDPARMAQNFAGVSAGNDQRNDIIVRGNSPLGVQYRLDGVVIPNPSHFGSLGTTGGPVSILNNNLLDNSDFMTGAFPSEYGNVLAGVFDLKMREGNHDKYEFLGQIGFNGVELGAEGPLKKDSKGSFLVNYRYSTLQFFDLMGISFGTAAVPQYQDLSFKLNLPTEKYGKFSIFGIGGLSYIELLSDEIAEDDLFGDNTEDTRFKANMGVVGINHLFFHNEKTFSRTSFTMTTVGNDIQVDRQVLDTLTQTTPKVRTYGNEFLQTKYSLNYTFNKKYSAKNNIQSGIIFSYYAINYQDSTLIDNDGMFNQQNTYYLPLRDIKEGTLLTNGFVHWRHKFNNKLTMNLGVHGQHFALNNEISIEPRAGISYKINNKQKINFGTGLHSQIQPFQTYYTETELDRENAVFDRTNENLKFTKSVHAIAGYDWSFAKNMRFKAEAYYQYLFKVPVGQGNSSFSMLNVGADFEIPDVDSLVNEGFGQNYGVEMTVEKFYDKGYYFLATASVFDSKYQGIDKKWRNTAFNGNYTLNALIGKEFKLNKKNVLSLDLNLTTAGGKRYTPYDVEETIATGETQYQDGKEYSLKYDNYFRLDTRLAFKRDGKKITQEWALDIQNTTNQKNIFTQVIDTETGEINTNYQLGLFPVFQYRILF